MNNDHHKDSSIEEKLYEVILSENRLGLSKQAYTPPRVGIRPGKKSPAHDLYRPALSLPNEVDNSASMREVILDLKQFFGSQAQVAPPALALCTLWTIHTWFADALPLSPPLIITGPRMEAESLLAALHAVCRNGLMVFAGAGLKDLKTLPIADLFPTLILAEPRLTKETQSLLSLSSRPGRLLAGSVTDVYRALRVPSVQDRYCPKAMYLGEDASCAVDISNIVRLHLAPDAASYDAPQVTASQLQNRLFTLRVRLWPEVEKSTFVADGLSAQTREVATALSRPLGEEATAQAGVVRLLLPQDEMKRAERANTLEALVLEGMISLIHNEGSATELLAGAIAGGVNQLLEERQESWTVSAEEVGHALKRMGLPSMRLGSAGRGLKLDNRTQANAHGLADYYGVLVPATGQECKFCERVGVDGDQAGS